MTGEWVEHRAVRDRHRQSGRRVCLAPRLAQTDSVRGSAEPNRFAAASGQKKWATPWEALTSSDSAGKVCAEVMRLGDSRGDRREEAYVCGSPDRRTRHLGRISSSAAGSATP